MDETEANVTVSAKVTRPFYEDSIIVALQAIVVSLLVNVWSSFRGATTAEWLPVSTTVLSTFVLQYYIYLKAKVERAIRLEIAERESRRRVQLEFRELQQIRDSYISNIARIKRLFEYLVPISLVIALVTVVFVNRGLPRI